MLTLEKLRKIDPNLAQMSDGDLEALRGALYETAQLAFDAYWEKEDDSKYPVGLLTPEADGATL